MRLIPIEATVEDGATVVRHIFVITQIELFTKYWICIQTNQMICFWLSFLQIGLANQLLLGWLIKIVRKSVSRYKVKC